MRVTIVALLFLSGNVSADWSTGHVKDELRGTQVEISDISVSPINGSGPDLYVSARQLDKAGVKFGIVFRIDSDLEKIDCQGYCNIPLRFDSHSLVDGGFMVADSGFVTPTTPNALIRAMGMSDSMVIEFSTTRKHTYQYKINMNGFKLNPAITPRVRIGGVVIGSEKSTLPHGFVPAKAADCFEGVDVVVEDSGLKIPQLFVCVRNDKIKSVSFGLRRYR